ncbi:hypothetical protein NDU88_003257 [Pleurodeles waltl]|uniref:Uncharacterized protein n=1 Tax=Pleurodeles waltl TaxID=8319 RepID=A0AAV7NIQ6_PLEWA|nr:hypothetical protein NDU88_003257 [Pleurodeles waltl]
MLPPHPKQFNGHRLHRIKDSLVRASASHRSIGRGQQPAPRRRAHPPTSVRHSLGSPSRARPGRSAARSSPPRGERLQRRGPRTRASRSHRSEGALTGAQGDQAIPLLLLPPSARCNQVRPTAPGKGRSAASSFLAPRRAPSPLDRRSSNTCSGGRRDLCTRLSQFGMRQGTGS